jgi:hypothetical protein
MFNIYLPYKSATPMKFNSSTKAWFKNLCNLFLDFARNFITAPSTSLRIGKNYCILRPVLWMQ